MARESETIRVRAEVELDIFSGMPNPSWTLTDDEADSFVRQLRALPRTSPRNLSGKLGYRGLIVRVTRGADSQLIRIQAGTVQLSEGATELHAHDGNRRLERWLLDTGRSRVSDELLQIAERDFR